MMKKLYIRPESTRNDVVCHVGILVGSVEPVPIEVSTVEVKPFEEETDPFLNLEF